MTYFDSTIRMVHAGGRGGMGPAECLLQLGHSLSLSIFEANIEGAIDGPSDTAWQDYGELIEKYAHRYDVKLSVIPLCLSNCVGKKTFHINVMPDCSSLFKMNPEAKHFTRMAEKQYRIIWGEICQPTRTVEIDVTTLDKEAIKSPHFLSLDVQGAEYDVLEGAGKALQGDLLGVISEVEFSELYEGQKLFTDQHALLNKHRFRLFELYSTEYWHTRQIIGKGALTVAEALFLRDYHYFIDKDTDPVTLVSNLCRLAIIAYYFDRLSYAFEILGYIVRNHQFTFQRFRETFPESYFQTLLAFYIKTERRHYTRNRIPTYSQYMANLAKPPSKSKARIINSRAYPLFKAAYLAYLSTRRIAGKALDLAYNLNLKMIVGKFISK